MSDFNEETVKNMVAIMGGTRRLALMIGAKNFAKGDMETDNPFFSFKFKAKAHDGINYFKIRYNAGLDLFDVEFGRIWGHKYTVKKEVEGVYVDMVREIFEDTTGLALTM
jgi:hypothetical protein